MTDTVFNISKGRGTYYGTLPAASDALHAMVLETSGLETDAVLQDSTTVTEVIDGATNEQTTLGRKTLASVAVTVDHTNNRQEVDAADLVWTAGTGNAFSRIVIFYVPDTTSASDGTNIPMVILDAVATPAGGDITYAFGANGFLRAS